MSKAQKINDFIEKFAIIGGTFMAVRAIHAAVIRKADEDYYRELHANEDAAEADAEPTSGVGGGRWSYDDLLPTVMEYSRYLDIAQNKFGISREEARKRYGLYSIGEWNKLLGIGKINPNRHGWTRVIFRKYPDGEIIALFPDEPWYSGYGLITSYMHDGQHSGAWYKGVIADTKPAKPSEYMPLFDELVATGYNNLEIAKRQ